MTTYIKELLKNFPLFQDLSEHEIESIASLSQQRQYPKDKHIFMHGEPITSVYFISSGTIKIYRTDPNGKEHIINILETGAMFPHQGFFRRGVYPAHAVALEDSVLFSIPIHAFEQFLLLNPEITIKIFRILGDLLVELQDRLEEKALRNTKEQLIFSLLRLSEKLGTRLTDDTVLIHTHFTNQELANMIGSSRETFNRLLTELKKRESISTNDSGHLIIYVKKLQEEINE